MSTDTEQWEVANNILILRKITPGELMGCIQKRKVCVSHFFGENNYSFVTVTINTTCAIFLDEHQLYALANPTYSNPSMAIIDLAKFVITDLVNTIEFCDSKDYLLNHKIEIKLQFKREFGSSQWKVSGGHPMFNEQFDNFDMTDDCNLVPAESTL